MFVTLHYNVIIQYIYYILNNVKLQTFLEGRNVLWEQLVKELKVSENHIQ